MLLLIEISWHAGEFQLDSSYPETTNRTVSLILECRLKCFLLFVCFF